MTVIGLWGYAGSGKDEVARFLVREHKFQRIAFADRLRAILYDLDPTIEDRNGPGIWPHLSELVNEVGWDKAKQVPEVRQLLQRLGNSARTHLHPEVWIDAAIDFADLRRVVITDVRYANEANTVKALGGWMVKVHRTGVGPINGHVTEHELEDYAFDATIWNDGTLQQLGTRVEDAMEKLGIL